MSSEAPLLAGAPSSSAPLPAIPPLRRPRLIALLLLGLATILLLDRLFLCTHFLFLYTDQDQTLLWYAAREFLHGRLHEPCFYGQAYNSCIEAYLAAPLLLARVPYEMALPLATVFLGLFPFLLVAWVAWRRRQPLAAALALAIPILLPTRYGMIAGIPRGFVTGLALAIVPAVWMLAPILRPRPPFRWDESAGVFTPLFDERFFGIAALSVIALTLNPNALLLLAPAYMYSARRWLGRAEFWWSSGAGALTGALYPIGMLLFYYVLHDDYRMHHRNSSYGWSIELLARFFSELPTAFGDLVPVGVPATWAAPVLTAIFLAIAAVAAIRRNGAVAAAVISCPLLTVMSFAYARVHMGDANVFMPLSRMFLALPIVVAWAVLAMGAGRTARVRERVSAMTVAMLMAIWLLSMGVGWQKYRTLSATIEPELDNTLPMLVNTVETARQTARAVQHAADQEHASFLLLDEDDRQFDYYLPLATTCETLFPRFERRTWRMYEENHPRYARILTLDAGVYQQARAQGYPHAMIIPGSPRVYAFDTRGESVVAICRNLGLRIRQFDETR